MKRGGGGPLNASADDQRSRGNLQAEDSLKDEAAGVLPLSDAVELGAGED